MTRVRIVDLTQPWGDRMPTWPQFASMDHSLYVRIRWMRPDLVREYEQLTGAPIEQTLPERDFEYVHYRTARSNVCMLENLGGELADVAGKRVLLGAFPWRWIGGEGCVCRVAAFVDVQTAGIEGATPPGAQPRRPDASRTPARVMADSATGVNY